MIIDVDENVNIDVDVNVNLGLWVDLMSGSEIVHRSGKAVNF